MFLDDLAQLFSQLTTRVSQHEALFRENEAMTRAGLVNPLLRAMGWDIEDPAVAVQEYPIASGRADYALFAGDPTTPALVVEATSFGTPLDPHLLQTLSYCVMEGIAYCAITDGANWVAYDVLKQGNIKDRVLARFDATDPDDPANVLNALWLWRGNFGRPAPPKVPPLKPLPPVVKKDEQWLSLPSVLAVLRKSRGHPAPTVIEFPDGTQAAMAAWRHCQPRVVEHATAIGSLTKDKCPIRTKRGTPIVDNVGTDFRKPVQVGRFWVDVHLSAKNQARLAINICEATGIDPDKVSLLWQPGT